MYATENYVKMQARELQNRINEVASDLGGDVKFLHSEILQIQQDMKIIVEQLESLKNV